MARLDAELVSRGIARSRQRAKEMIQAGSISVNGSSITKASAEVSPDDVIESSEEELYVGRGALKLEKAAAEFGLDFDGKTCIDIGASTGGFTDLMLSRGAAKVFAVDVGHGQLAEKLRSDPRVVNMEGTDIRTVSAEDLGGCADIITVDVSFISLKMILPKVYELLNENACAAVLIKPQFEAGRSGISKNGIVKDRKVHLRVLREIDEFARETGFVCEKYTYSPVKGGSGNIEYLVKLCRSGAPAAVHDLKALVESAFEKL
ncbi:MAG: TlyA family RNA methyltransferase [Ruminococcus sp.]|nr:TlyA family RNA methyltransferase [Ruminococcus sp.]